MSLETAGVSWPFSSKNVFKVEIFSAQRKRKLVMGECRLFPLEHEGEGRIEGAHSPLNLPLG